MGALFYWWFLEPGLVLAATYGVVAYVSRKIGKPRTVAAKLGWAFLIGYPLWLLLPEWDNVIGKQKFDELCATDAGVRVFRPVILSKERFGPGGLPVFLDRSRSGDKRFGEKYRFDVREDWVWRPDFSVAAILRKIESIYEAESKKLLGQHVSIHFRLGGVPLIVYRKKWLVCPKESERTSGEILGRAVFQAEMPNLEEPGKLATDRRKGDE